ncbi:uncharacterized protein LOC144431984 [Styela clava]
MSGPSMILVGLHESHVRWGNSMNPFEQIVFYLSDLKIGMTLAIFNEDGKMPNRSELLKNSVRHGDNISATYLRKRLGMPSAPIAFPTRRVANSIVSSFIVAGLKNMDWFTRLPR